MTFRQRVKENGDLDFKVITCSGEVVAMGTPEEVATSANSWTGRYLKRMLTKV